MGPHFLGCIGQVMYHQNITDEYCGTCSRRPLKIGDHPRDMAVHRGSAIVSGTLVLCD